MLSLRRGRVTAIVEEHEGLVRLEVDGSACVAYPDLTGPVAVEDDVLVNVQARELGLGSGGFDVLYANLTRGLGLPAAEGAHVMKLPYSPLQAAAAVIAFRNASAMRSGMSSGDHSTGLGTPGNALRISELIRVSSLSASGSALPIAR